MFFIRIFNDYFKGQFIDNFHEKRFQLLKNDFNVYECDSIQCQIHFQKKTIQLNVNDFFVL